MSTLLEAAKTLIKVLELEKSQIVLSMTSGRALEQLEQAIAQEQPKLKHKMPARGCYTCKHEDERIECRHALLAAVRTGSQSHDMQMRTLASM